MFKQRACHGELTSYNKQITIPGFNTESHSRDTIRSEGVSANIKDTIKCKHRNKHNKVLVGVIYRSCCKLDDASWFESFETLLAHLTITWDGILYACINVCDPRFESCHKFIQDTKSLDELLFIDDFSKLPLSVTSFSDDPDEQLDSLNLLFTECLERHAPLQKVKVTRRPAPWMKTPHIEDLQQERNTLRHVAHLPNAHSSTWNSLHLIRNKLKQAIRSAHKPYHQTNHVKSGAIHRILKPSPKPSPRPLRMDPGELNVHFSTVQQTIGAPATSLDTLANIIDSLPEILDNIQHFTIQPTSSTKCSQYVDDMTLCHHTPVQDLAGGKDLERFKNTKLLGVYLNKNLLWDEHVKNLASSCYTTLASLRKIKHFTPYKLQKHLAESLILSRLDYCDIVMFPLPQHLLKRLQCIQFAAASFVTGWLPVRECQDWHLLKMAHKALYNYNWPQTLRLEKVKHTQLLRSNSTVNLVVLRVSNTFQDTAAWIFNTQPSGTKLCVDSKSFSKQAFTFLKSHLS
ncbi:hypothetical protein pdam_00025340 [Pocillopora damicornis]|uniref:Uncharacterized protein n=1 Tax=Pocillopora damicornis TaxID=46731 RepID=A0A3M6TUM5_POCDA|nr:hypothetical protein pdam_00025340 [Pocillopora damicornis]